MFIINGGLRMYKLGLIEESIDDKSILDAVKQFFFSGRIEEVPEDEVTIWHTNEYHVPDDKLASLLLMLQNHIKPTWYIHAFNEKELYVVLKGRSFRISKEKDKSWDEMIQYGVEVAEVERRFLENVPLHI